MTTITIELNQPLDVDDGVDNIPTPAPLRRPYSPAREDKDDGSDRGSKKYLPPGHHPKPGQRNANNNRDDNRNQNYDRRHDKQGYGQDKQGYGQDRQPFGQNRQGKRQEKSVRYFDKEAVKNLRKPHDVNDEDSGNNGQNYSPPHGQRNQNWQKRPQFMNNKYHQRDNSTSTCDDDDENWDSNKPQAKDATSAAQNDAPKAMTQPAKPPMQETTKPAFPRSPANQSAAQPAAANHSLAKVATANQSPAKAATAIESPAKPAAANEKPPSVANEDLSKKLVPKNCVAETLPVGETLLLSVDNTASECLAGGIGFVCLSLHEAFEADYQALCEDYQAQPVDNYTPSAGETFSLWSEEEGGWYRARCLGDGKAALLDGAKVVPIGAKVAPLPPKFAIVPEFSCLLQADVKVGDSLKATIASKTARGLNVSLSSVEGAPVGGGEVARWLPAVTYPAPAPAAAPAPASTAAAPAKAAIPEVPRPALEHRSRVMLVHVESNAQGVDVFLRPADSTAFDAVLHDTALYGITATPLKEPPSQGQFVVSKYEDDLHYRALVKRTSVKQNKYLLEYLEYGNTQINQLEKLYPCPANLLPSTHAVLTRRARLQASALTPAATAYLDTLKDSQELIVSLPDGSSSVPSGSQVTLTVAKNNENVNRKVEQLSTPDWEKIEKRGGDVLEVPKIMYSELEYLELPQEGCELLILDYSALGGGTLSACRRNHEHINYVLTSLTQRMNEYCESKIGREPYLPGVEELCIAQLPPYPQWFRAVLAEQVSGPGGAECEVCYIDYGNMERVSVSLLRKMLPEFVRGIPALANTIEIQDFPESPTVEQLERAIEHLQLNEEGQGTLRVTKCVKEGPGMYTVHAPELLQAINKK